MELINCEKYSKGKFMQAKLIHALAYGLLALSPALSYAQFSNPFASEKTIPQQRQDILKKSEDTLKALYQAQPKAKELIEKSVGYATFSNFGMKILIAGGGTGSGVVIPKDGAKPVYMNMAEVQAGLGIGIKSFQNIFVFQGVFSDVVFQFIYGMFVGRPGVNLLVRILECNHFKVVFVFDCLFSHDLAFFHILGFVKH